MTSVTAVNPRQVPFVDLKAQYRTLKTELDTAISNVLAETAFISGKYAATFEKEFAEYIGAEHCIAVANGTDALEIGLQSLGVTPGDEVLVPANTWISTAEAVSNIGAVPVFVDIDPANYTIDPELIESRITSKTRAIIPVHLYGLPADMPQIVPISEKHGLKILEDCAQAHGAKLNGKTVGTFGHAATFSFYPSKNLGAFGDAGGIVTSDPDVAGRARLISNHGQTGKNLHALEGRNSRMDGIQAAVLSVKLPHLEKWLDARRNHAGTYVRLLALTGLALPFEPEGYRHTYHLFVVRCEERDRVLAELAGKGIECAIHYPTALPFIKAYERFGHTPEDFPVAFEQQSRILSLPMFAELTDEMVEFVCESLAEAVR